MAGVRYRHFRTTPETLTGTSASATFAELKNASRNNFFTHKITFDYTDFQNLTGPTPGLSHVIYLPLFTDSNGITRGTIKGVLVREIVLCVRENFTGMANQQTATLQVGTENDGINPDPDAYLTSLNCFSGSPNWKKGNGTRLEDGSYIDTTNASTGNEISVTLTTTVSSGTDTINDLTQGKGELYLDIVNMNDLAEDLSWKKMHHTNPADRVF